MTYIHINFFLQSAESTEGHFLVEVWCELCWWTRKNCWSLSQYPFHSWNLILDLVPVPDTIGCMPLLGHAAQLSKFPDPFACKYSQWVWKFLLYSFLVLGRIFFYIFEIGSNSVVRASLELSMYLNSWKFSCLSFPQVLVLQYESPCLALRVEIHRWPLARGQTWLAFPLFLCWSLVISQCIWDAQGLISCLSSVKKAIQ